MVLTFFVFVFFLFFKGFRLGVNANQFNQVWRLPEGNQELSFWGKCVHIYRVEFLKEICVAEQKETAKTV